HRLAQPTALVFRQHGDVHDLVEGATVADHAAHGDGASPVEHLYAEKRVRKPALRRLPRLRAEPGGRTQMPVRFHRWRFMNNGVGIQLGHDSVLPYPARCPATTAWYRRNHETRTPQPV